MLGSSRHLLVAAAALGSVACAHGPTPCASYGSCPDGQECLANRCVVAGGEPVPAKTERVVLEPLELVVVSRDERAQGSPGAVILGRDGLSEQRLYLRFPPLPTPAKAHVEGAFLLLDPLPGAQPGGDDIELVLWRVEEDWSATAITWLRQPDLGPPSSRAIARNSPPTRTRIDLTELVRYFHTRPRAQRGVALVASSESALGVTLATGRRGGRGPQLEIYWRPTEESR